MAIKLNEKGKLKVAMADVSVVMLPTDPPKYRASKEADALEFEPDDFQGMVCLTVNQAKELALKLMSNDEFFFRQTGEFDYDTEDLWQCLTDKIEQAEGKL